jgi:cathepsin K
MMMKCFLAFAAFCVSPLQVTGDCTPFDFLPDIPGVTDFENWYANFKPIFTQSDLTTSDRLQLLRNSFTFVKNHNSQGASNYSLAINELSAYSQIEIKQRNGFRHILSQFPDFSSVVPNMRSLQNLPASIDWAEAGAVTAVKNQQQCGCCWAIAITGAIEGAAAIDSNFTYLQSLSFQQLISCDNSNGGCSGGSTVSALDYSVNNDFGGLTTFMEYPFVDQNGVTTTGCKLSGHTLAVGDTEPSTVTDTDTGDDFSTRMTKMKQALVYGGPVAIVINGDCRELQAYSSGVLSASSCACSDSSCLDHAVLLVGYNDTNNPAYWKIKNSWGECWGENGYFRLSQVQRGEWGELGVLAQGVLPLTAYNRTPQVSSAMPFCQPAVVSSVVVLLAIAGFLIAT